MKKLSLLIDGFMVVLILIGIAKCHMTYAVVPNQYSESTYANADVNKIAHEERASGVRVVYANNEFNFWFIYVPLLVSLLCKTGLALFCQNNKC